MDQGTSTQATNATVPFGLETADGTVFTRDIQPPKYRYLDGPALTRTEIEAVYGLVREVNL